MNAYEVMVSHQNFVVIGMSDNPDRYSYKVYKKLQEYNKTVYGVNPRLESVEGEAVYNDLTEVPKSIDIAILMVNPKIGIDYIKEIKAQNIPYLWIQPGAESDEIIEKAKSLDLTVIESCVLREYKAKEIRMVVCDLDETLLQEDRSVSDLNRRAIQALKDKNILFVPATGRPYYSMKQTLDELELYTENDLAISYNGGMIHQTHNHQKMVVHDMAFDLVNWLYKFGIDKDVAMHTYIEDKTYAYNLNDDERDYIKNFPGIVEHDDKDLNFLKGTPILKIIYQNTDLDYLREIEKEIPDSIKEHLEISYSSNRYLEFNPLGISKGMAVEYLAEKLNIRLEDILSIGDNLNDLSMLQITGVSGAPANAVDIVKDAVIYNSPRTNTNGAVYDILKRTKLIENI